MRRLELEEFAQRLYALEQQFSVEVCSDNYYTPAAIIDRKHESVYHYGKGKVEEDER